MSVNFYFEKKAILRQRRKLKQFIAYIFKNENKMMDSLAYIFCDDEYLLNINRRFLKHDYYTDIITFDLSEQVSYIVGEIYISIDRVNENAAIHRSAREQEINRVIFHGALHLCGYKDKTGKQKLIMKKKEDQYLREFQRSTWNNTPN